MYKRIWGCAAVMAGLLAGPVWFPDANPAFGDTKYDLTSGSDTVVINGAVFENDFTQPAGSGVFLPFVRIQAHGNNSMEEGYNTSGRPLPFDEKNPLNFTHDLMLSTIPTITRDNKSYYQFKLDIDESNGNNQKKSLLSLDELQIYTSSTGGKTTTTLSDLGTLRYDLDEDQDNYILLNGGLKPGSGTTDMHALIPAANFSDAGSEDFLYLYSRFGLQDGAGADAGYEEWAADPPAASAVPAPAAAWAGLLGLGLLAASLRGGPARNRRSGPALG